MGRRVLADLEWWMVAGGQRDVGAERGSEPNDQEQSQATTDSVEDAASFVAEAGVERPFTPSVWASTEVLF